MVYTGIRGDSKNRKRILHRSIWPEKEIEEEKKIAEKKHNWCIKKMMEERESFARSKYILDEKEMEIGIKQT